MIFKGPFKSKPFYDSLKLACALLNVNHGEFPWRLLEQSSDAGLAVAKFLNGLLVFIYLHV